MFSHRILQLGSIAVLSLAATLATSGDFSEENGVALGRFDAVSYFSRDHQPILGVRDYSTVYKESKFYFVTSSDLAKFSGDPEKFAPQFGGFCAYNAGQGQKVPASPRIFAMLDDKLYLFSSTEARAAWKKDAPANIARASEHWSELSQLMAKDH